ncbi:MULTISPECIES: GNAT family N-acetyltransferase [Shouchella]|uniref:Acetyltransferase n=3 Tax=Bacillaceae TaxID=186817 RepID=A0A060LY83_9BACI|nr:MULTISPECIES: GNAT family N-acetyltransferase [Bacillaceae]AIC95127.1 acetyltransferase [Shouchella lehensis G1]KQL57630.1 acetyltransferase [Alkalicoccobacillus plakortidis]MBG9784054.1 acetyltransferase [Shouchella lehensis]TES50970.1 GNAT family N-acetyltransferase [Shouchella lehensis]
MIDIVELSADTTAETKRELTSLFEKQLHNIAGKQAITQIETLLNEALLPQSQTYFFIARYEGTAVAFAFFNTMTSFQKGGQYIWLNEIYVDEAYRNQGIAKKLLLRIIYWAENRKIKGIELETGLHNEATKALYNSLGFYDVVSKRYSFRF